jgi:hypothetical protein
MTSFEPQHMGDLRSRHAALWLKSARTPYPDGLWEEVLDLIVQSKKILQFDAIGAGFVMQAVGFLNDGKLRQSLASMKLAYDSYLPT